MHFGVFGVNLESILRSCGVHFESLGVTKLGPKLELSPSHALKNPARRSRYILAQFFLHIFAPFWGRFGHFLEHGADQTKKKKVLEKTASIPTDLGLILGTFSQFWVRFEHVLEHGADQTKKNKILQKA